MACALTLRRTETRNLMMSIMELENAKREGDADGARWAIGDLVTLARMAGTQRVQSRAIAELCRIGFWSRCQPEPAT